MANPDRKAYLQVVADNTGPLKLPLGNTGRPLAKEPGDPQDGNMSDLGERIARLEGAMDGLRHSQTVMIAVAALVGAFVIGFGVYGLQRIDRVEERVNTLPSEISAELRGITSTLSEAITAAGNRQPVIIQVPPQPAPEPSQQ